MMGGWLPPVYGGIIIVRLIRVRLRCKMLKWHGIRVPDGILVLCRHVTCDCVTHTVSWGRIPLSYAYILIFIVRLIGNMPRYKTLKRHGLGVTDWRRVLDRHDTCVCVVQIESWRLSAYSMCREREHYHHYVDWILNT